MRFIFSKLSALAEVQALKNLLKGLKYIIRSTGTSSHRIHPYGEG